MKKLIQSGFVVLPVPPGLIYRGGKNRKNGKIPKLPETGKTGKTGALELTFLWSADVWISK
jgi:hypothetical protein